MMKTEVKTTESYQVIKLFRNYIIHARQIHLKGSPFYYRREYRLDALEKCERHYAYFRNMRPEAACLIILHLERELREILPIRDNNSFDSSVARLEHILQLAQKYNPAK